MSELSKAKNRKVGFVLGLTGGIATGKSTAAKVFQSHGFPLIDGDVIARETVEPGTLALRKIVSVFGQEVLQPDGQLDRGKLGMIVFPSKEFCEQLQRLMKRNQLTLEQAQQRISSQLPIEEKKQRADILFDNNGTKEKLVGQIENWLFANRFL